MNKKIISVVVGIFVFIALGSLIYLLFSYFWKPNQKTNTTKPPTSIINKSKGLNNNSKQNSISPFKTSEPDETATSEINEKQATEQKLEEKPHKTNYKKQIKIKKATSKKINVFSKYFLERTFKNLKKSINWKKAIHVVYANTTNKNKFDNNREIRMIYLQPDVLQKLFVREIAKRLNFEDLLVTFEYFNALKKFKIKIAFAKKTKIFIEKKYKLKKT